MSDEGNTDNTTLDEASSRFDEISQDVKKKSSIKWAIRGYLQAVARFEQASTAFNASCQEVRNTLGKNAKFVVDSDYKTYLVESDDEGNFKVEPVESL